MQMLSCFVIFRGLLRLCSPDKGCGQRLWVGPSVLAGVMLTYYKCFNEQCNTSSLIIDFKLGSPAH